MTILFKGKTEIRTVFNLLGENEDDITYSLAWILKNSNEFLDKFLQNLLEKPSYNLNDVFISIQTVEQDKGRTDIEIFDNNTFHIVIEAKKGWIIPDRIQLEKYSLRESFRDDNNIEKKIISLSECSNQYYNAYFNYKIINGIIIQHLSYSEIFNLVEESVSISNNKNKILLKEFNEYLGGIVNMQKQNTNNVFVVSLGRSKINNCDLTWVDIVEKKGKYFHPVGKNWPSEPVTYIAFRYDGVLKSIHHVDDYIITKNLNNEINELPNVIQELPHFVYTLGKAIYPDRKIRTGKIYRSGRVWAHLDLLLTSESISDARDQSQIREKSQTIK